MGPQGPSLTPWANLHQLCHQVLVPKSGGRPVLQCAVVPQAVSATTSHTLGAIPRHVLQFFPVDIHRS